MSEGLLAMLYKLTGAGVGSGLAVWFRKSPRWALQLACGIAVGYLAGPWFLDWMEWQMTTDYILLAGAIMGGEIPRQTPDYEYGKVSDHFFTFLRLELPNVISSLWKMVEARSNPLRIWTPGSDP